MLDGGHLERQATATTATAAVAAAGCAAVAAAGSVGPWLSPAYTCSNIWPWQRKWHAGEYAATAPRYIPHTAHRTPHTARTHRTPHTAHRTPHTAHRTPHTAHSTHAAKLARRSSRTKPTTTVNQTSECRAQRTVPPPRGLRYARGVASTVPTGVCANRPRKPAKFNQAHVKSTGTPTHGSWPAARTL